MITVEASIFLFSICIIYYVWQNDNIAWKWMSKEPIHCCITRVRPMSFDIKNLGGVYREDFMKNDSMTIGQEHKNTNQSCISAKMIATANLQFLQDDRDCSFFHHQICHSQYSALCCSEANILTEFFPELVFLTHASHPIIVPLCLEGSGDGDISGYKDVVESWLRSRRAAGLLTVSWPPQIQMPFACSLCRMSKWYPPWSSSYTQTVTFLIHKIPLASKMILLQAALQQWLHPSDPLELGQQLGIKV